MAHCPRFRWLLLASNAVACVFFVVVREPPAPEYLAEWESAHRTGGIFLNSAVDGMVACRPLYSWSDWHGGEALWVKSLEVANMPALALAGVFGAAGELGVARMFPICTWSWILGGVFLVAASVQWWLAGVVIDNVVGLLRRRRRNKTA
jgi:hypothetical protein